MKYICEHCRNQVTDSQKFCGNCGSQLQSINDSRDLYEVRGLSEDELVYGNVVFMQGEEADIALDMFDEGLDRLKEYLLQWDDGTYEPVFDDVPSGTGDDDLDVGDYVITVRPRMPYVGMVRKLNREAFIERFGEDQIERV